MVKLEEVEDEAFIADKLGPQDDEENEWENTDDGTQSSPSSPLQPSIIKPQIPHTTDP